MKLNPTPNLQSLYRDLFGLTADEIDQIAIGTPVRARLIAPPGGPLRSLREQPHDVPTTPCAARTAAFRFLD
ncbi:hypothetical protein A2T82_35285 (plasmid) [Burkholderia cenocepacia]|uniref:hypothetical protein n=1 Tax=Burkholderia cenocepacia TaxID=95486 RepID=UPI00078CD08A|nr:hypothetical protein [Burkholderia cenocepacia]AMU04566.1 hypothetical protein A2T82_35285 [Burkholderia cenocepacia]MBR8270491.1 hypothetical protein [Burkholderia cenocepacia]